MAAAKVPVTEAFKLAEEKGYAYLDVRTPEEYAAGHAKGAHNIPYLISGHDGRAPNPDFLVQVKAEFENVDSALLVNCKGGGRSAKASAVLLDAGYTDVVDVQGGYDAWSAAGLPTE